MIPLDVAGGSITLKRWVQGHSVPLPLIDWASELMATAERRQMVTFSLHLLPLPKHPLEVSSAQFRREFLSLHQQIDHFHLKYRDQLVPKCQN